MHTLDNVPHTCIIELAAAAAAPGFTHETPGNAPGKAGRTYARAKYGYGSKRCGANKATEQPPAGAAPLQSGLGSVSPPGHSGVVTWRLASVSSNVP